MMMMTKPAPLSYLCTTMDGRASSVHITSVDELKRLMQSDYVRQLVEEIRRTTQNPWNTEPGEQERDRVRRLKAQLPMIFYSGIYVGQGTTRRKEDFVYNGNVLVDVDKFPPGEPVPDLQDIIDELDEGFRSVGKQLLEGRLLLALVSPSGFFRLLIRVPPEESTGDIRQDYERLLPLFGRYRANIDRGATPIVTRPSYASLWNEVGYLDGEGLFREREQLKTHLNPPCEGGLENSTDNDVRSIKAPSLTGRDGVGLEEAPLLLQEYILAHPRLARDLHTQGVRNNSLFKLCANVCHLFASEQELADAVSEYSPLSAAEVRSVAHSAWGRNKVS